MAVTSPIPGARFVDPAVLARVGNLQLVAKSVVDGLINGTHRSPFFGASVDFAEHRGYVAGDDIRRVDWRVYARTDKYYIKEFEADSNANFSVLLDVSTSMGFGAAVSKLDYAKTLAACLTYMANQQRDRVGLITFDADIVDHVPPSAKHLDVVLHTLDRAVAARPGRFGPPMRKLAEHFGRRGIVVVISDCYAEPDEIFDGLGPIRSRGNDVVLFHVLDPQEIDFGFAEPSSFEDMESGDQMPIVPGKLAADYRKLVAAHVETLTTRASQQRMDYMLLNTSLPLDFALFRFLSLRERLSHVR
ncbi:MAG: hypothetical protein A3J29_13355 [Acidobacteria bacterium RIFCSPLOWO2_12_FULL_67_14b]|nr:MAG: hypothetical protein A3J29_13355 [Acidobacteria bacterium RIFCSPLOWO2_12_FULL_67_14b]